MSSKIESIQKDLEEYFPSIVGQVEEGNEIKQALSIGVDALSTSDPSLSWSQLNQIMHLCSQAGISQGFYKYYFLSRPERHPYPVENVFKESFRPPEDGQDIKSFKQFFWGIRRFIYDAMLYWGNFRQAYRDLRQLNYNEIERCFESKRMDESLLVNRGQIKKPLEISLENRYLISEIACEVYSGNRKVDELKHVKYLLETYDSLKGDDAGVLFDTIHQQALNLATKNSQGSLFELLVEKPKTSTVKTKEDLLAPYENQIKAFNDARKIALLNTKIYLSMCNDLDVYVATSMRSRQDFRDMAKTCEYIFKDELLAKYRIRYFDPTLSATEHHEDKGIIECLMVKTAKVVLYFAQHKESLGKVSEYAMALSLGKPVIILCPSDEKGTELYNFYREKHPLLRLIEFKTGIVNGAIVTNNAKHVTYLLDRILSNKMEYDFQKKANTTNYFLLKERITQSTVRVITDNKLLTETFWNNYHKIY